MTMLLLCAALIHDRSYHPAALLLAAAAIGVENGTFLRDREVAVGLTYMTGTLVRAAQRLALALAGGKRWAWLPDLLLWFGFLAGVVLGTLAFRRLGFDAMWIAALLALLLTLAAARLVSRRAT